MDSQQGDVLLFQTPDDGEINIEGGITEMTPGFASMSYLCLFGGNEDDDGRDSNPKNWWGNLDEVDKANQYRSETQNLLKSLPATSGNLLKVEDAATRDLNPFIEKKIASSVTVIAIIPALNRIKLTITILALGKESTFEFTENWKAAA